VHGRVPGGAWPQSSRTIASPACRSLARPSSEEASK
jgi:hypothetical protein